MKKYINYLFIFGMLYFAFIINCYASAETYTRTNEDLRIPSDVVADSNNHDDILSTPSVNANDKIYDFANLLTQEQEEKIYDKIVEYKKVSNYDAVIVTTNDLVGKDLPKYAYNFYDYNDFNSEGVIFVIHVGQGEPGIYMGNCAPSGSYLFNVYNNKVINSTMKYLYENSIRKENYYEACFNFVRVVQGFYVQRQNGSSTIGGNGEIVKTIPIFELLVISLAVTFIIVIVLIKVTSKNSKYSYSLNDKINGATLSIVCDYDKFVE